VKKSSSAKKTGKFSHVNILTHPFFSPKSWHLPLFFKQENHNFFSCVRSFWCDTGTTINDFCTTISGSSDLYTNPTIPVHFVSSHKGFTLLDSFSYKEKHNEENGFKNEDGPNVVDGVNCGEEGKSENEEINQVWIWVGLSVGR
jgi:isoamylase